MNTSFHCCNPAPVDWTAGWQRYELITKKQNKMRTIKFRAKFEGEDKWSEGILIPSSVMNNGAYLLEIDDSAKWKDYRLVRSETVEQFTGLKDCDGREIFEHDYIQNQTTKSITEVVWDEKMACFSLVPLQSANAMPTMNVLGAFLSDKRFKYKVVGNKFYTNITEDLKKRK